MQYFREVALKLHQYLGIIFRKIVQTELHRGPSYFLKIKKSENINGTISAINPPIAHNFSTFKKYNCVISDGYRIPGNQVKKWVYI